MTNERIEEILTEAKPCPFCHSDKLDISSKSNGHDCVYCRKCMTYGPRVMEYCLYEDCKRLSKKGHYFKNLKDKRNNSDGDKYHPSFVKNDDSEIPYEWYYIEAVRKLNERGLRK